VEDNRRISAVIKALRGFLKRDDDERELLCLEALVEEVLALAHSDLLIRNIGIRRAFDANLPKVRVNRIQIQQVIMNLVLNGCDAMAKAAVPERVLMISMGPDDYGDVRMELLDRGTGFSDIALSKAFEPFFTTKQDGLGLGLPTCKSIIAAHGGTLTVRNNPDVGATVSFTLPAEKNPK
jgi:C4-dicarboxylate-specific signal transduction histidine kinase